MLDVVLDDREQFPINLNFLTQNYYLPIARHTPATSGLELYYPCIALSIRTTQYEHHPKQGRFTPLPTWKDQRLLSLFLAKSVKASIFQAPVPQREIFLDTDYIAGRLGHKWADNPRNASNLRDQYAESLFRWGCKFNFKNWYDSVTQSRIPISFSIVEEIIKPEYSSKLGIRFSTEFFTFNQNNYRVMLDLNQWLQLSIPVASRVYETLCYIRTMKKFWIVKESILIRNLFLSEPLSNLRISVKRKKLRAAINEVCEMLGIKVSLKRKSFMFIFD